MIRTLPTLSLLAAALTMAVPASAQPLGTFRWQLQPYCNIVSVLVTQNGGTYRLEGTDDQCGTGSVSASAIGTAFVNPNGTIGIGLHVVSSPLARPASLSATLSLTTLSGTWTDNVGSAGNFVFTPGPGTGGSPRPLVGPGTGPITSVLAGPGLAASSSGGTVMLGVQTTASGAFRLDSNNGLLSRGTFDLRSPIPANGPGTRFMWYPGKAAIRAGNVVSTQWDDANIGYQSAAFGANTTASGFHSVAMGDSTQAFGAQSVALGHFTAATGAHALSMGDQTVASGANSLAVGSFSGSHGAESVALGLRVIAGGNGSVVLGSDARTQAAAVGSFVFGDRSTANDIVSFAPNEFIVRAAGGIGLYTNAATTSGVEMAPGSGAWQVLSDRNMKRDFKDLSGEDVLAKIAGMPVQEWSYTTQDASIRHVGPTAQDFHAAFGLGEHPLRINTVDADGVALAAIRALEARTSALREENARMVDLNQALQRANDDLRERLSRLERLIIPRQ